MDQTFVLVTGLFCLGFSMTVCSVIKESNNTWPAINWECNSTVEVYCSPPSPILFERSTNTSVSCETYIPHTIRKEKLLASFRSIFTADHFSMKSGRVNRIYSDCSRNNYFRSIWNGSVSNSFVKYLDLSGVGLTYLPGNIFDNFTSLQHLNLSNNFISGYDSDFSLTMPNIVSLDMSSNMLSEADLDWTIFNPALEYLSLSSCKLKTITSSKPLYQSMTLILSNNTLKCIDKNWIKTNITIYLEGNPVSCECTKSLQNGTYDKCICDEFDQIPFQITPTFTLMLFCILTAAVLVMYIIYVYQSILCLHINYLKNLIMMTFQSFDAETTVNDAYIVCDEYNSKILKKILFELGEKRHLKLTCEQENLPFGECMVTYIKDSLWKSKRTVFVMSPHFLDSNICMFVLREAAAIELFEHKCIIMIIKLQPTKEEHVKLQQKLTTGKICFEYPSNDEDNESFWNDLAAAINDAKLQFRILGKHHQDVIQV